MAIAARPAVLADALVPREWVQTRVNRLATDLALMFGFAWFVALFAQMAIRLPWTPVPITGQTFAVLVTGGALGANRGAGSLVMYMLMGMIGIPVFAPGEKALAMDGTWGVHFLFPWVGKAELPWEFYLRRRIHCRIHTRRLGNRVLRREVVGPKTLGTAGDAGGECHSLCSRSILAILAHLHRMGASRARVHFGRSDQSGRRLEQDSHRGSLPLRRWRPHEALRRHSCATRRLGPGKQDQRGVHGRPFR